MFNLRIFRIFVITISFYRLLAFWANLVQRIRHMRRSSMFRFHNAHVFHQSGPISRHTQSPEDAPQHHNKNCGPSDLPRVVAIDAGIQFDNRLGSYKLRKYYAPAENLRHQQQGLFRLRFAGGVLYAHVNHGGIVCLNGAVVKKKGTVCC